MSDLPQGGVIVPAPTMGRIVHYRLGDYDADQINAKRNANRSPGNEVAAGQSFPAMVVRAWQGKLVNLQVFLDGEDTYWATSRKHGHGDGEWCWPTRVGS